MDKNLFQDRQHISVSRLNGVYSDTESYLAEVFNDTLPLASSTITTSFSPLAPDPSVLSTNELTFSGGTAYDSSIFRMVAAAPLTISWENNSSGSGNRNDIVYAQGSLSPTDPISVFFKAATGTIFEQVINQRVEQIANLAVAIGAQYSGPFSGSQDPVLPVGAVPLVRVFNYPGSTHIVSSDQGSNAYVIDIRKVYPFTFENGFTLEMLADVKIGIHGQGNLVNGQILRWDGSEWTNSTDLAGPSPVSYSGSSIVVPHNLGFYPVVQVLDSSANKIIPDSIVHNSVNQFTVNFISARSGTIVYK